MLINWTLPRVLWLVALVLVFFSAGQALGYFQCTGFTCPTDCCATKVSGGFYNGSAQLAGPCNCEEANCPGGVSDCSSSLPCDIQYQSVAGTWYFWCGCSGQDDICALSCCIAYVTTPNFGDPPWTFGDCQDVLDRCGAQACHTQSIPVVGGCRRCICN